MKNKLIEMFELAKKNNAQYVGVRIKVPNMKKAETILNPKENFDKKLEYYLNAYDDNLKLKANPDIIIVDCFLLDNFI